MISYPGCGLFYGLPHTSPHGLHIPAVSVMDHLRPFCHHPLDYQCSVHYNVVTTSTELCLIR